MMGRTKTLNVRLISAHENWTNAKQGRFHHANLDEVDIETMLYYKGFDEAVENMQADEVERLRREAALTKVKSLR